MLASRLCGRTGGASCCYAFDPPGRALIAAKGRAGSLLPRSAPLHDLVVLRDLDVVVLRGPEDLLASLLPGGLTLEVSLVPARHRVPNVLLVVDRQMFAALIVDVGEIALL